MLPNIESILQGKPRLARGIMDNNIIHIDELERAQIQIVKKDIS